MKNVCIRIFVTVGKLRINAYHEGIVHLKHTERFTSFTNISPTKLAKITELGTTLLVNVWALAHAHYGNINLYGGQSGNIYKSENINSECPLPGFYLIDNVENNEVCTKMLYCL